MNPEPNKDCKFCEGKLKYCPYHTPPQDKICTCTGQRMVTGGKVPTCVQRKLPVVSPQTGSGGRPVHSVQGCQCADCSTPQEEPWIAEFRKRFAGEGEYYYDQPNGHYSDVDFGPKELESFIQKTLEADRKERAGVVVERVVKMFDKDALNESGDTMVIAALYAYSRGWNNAINKAVEIIKDVMK